MNDPHVVALVYRIEHGKSIDFNKAEPFCRDEQGFRLSVTDAKARFEMHDHFPTIAAADEALTEYRRAWEFDAQLKRGPDSFHLVLDREKSELVDRKPTPGRVGIHGSGGSAGTFSATLCLGPSAYPELPSGITLNPDVETMHGRYMGYRKGREPLASMANFCLTVLEGSTGKKISKRQAAAQERGIAKHVLNKIGELADTKGGKEARKGKGVGEDFSAAERRFLEHSVKVIIRRMAESPASSGTLPMISMSDLPPLDNDSDSKPKTKEQ